MYILTSHSLKTTSVLCVEDGGLPQMLSFILSSFGGAQGHKQRCGAGSDISVSSTLYSDNNTNKNRLLHGEY